MDRLKNKFAKVPQYSTETTITNAKNHDQIEDHDIDDGRINFYCTIHSNLTNTTSVGQSIRLSKHKTFQTSHLPYRK